MKKMAQKTEKEETEIKVVSETITPCINASTTTTTTGSSSAASGGVANSINRGKSPRSSSPRASSSSATLRSVDLKKGDDRAVVREGKEENRTIMMKREVNRCLCCGRRVALTGFRCRCGEMFCSEHRYSDRHDCSYDYKAAGREAIARENPVVKAAKIIKI